MVNLIISIVVGALVGWSSNLSLSQMLIITLLYAIFLNTKKDN
jgi:hypothetical protein